MDLRPMSQRVRPEQLQYKLPFPSSYSKPWITQVNARLSCCRKVLIWVFNAKCQDISFHTLPGKRGLVISPGLAGIEQLVSAVYKV